MNEMEEMEEKIGRKRKGGAMKSETEKVGKKMLKVGKK